MMSCELHYELLYNALNDAKVEFPAELEREADNDHKLIGLIKNIYELKKLVMELAKGDLSFEVRQKGRFAGALKGIQANLRHLTWQTKAIADGDLTQHVDFMGEFSQAFNKMVAGIAEDRRQLVILATTDLLTGMPNRRSFIEKAERLVAEHSTTLKPIAAIMMDLDYFKKINDSYGHEAGDEVLKSFAQLCMNTVRDVDVLGRLGGEEFAILLPETTVENARQIAERIKARLQDRAVYYEEHKIKFTASIGLAGGVGAINLDSLLRDSDAAMYQAKQNGRNRVEVFAKEN
ncbi:MAG: GGDEF domain-containing protein [Bacillota bacterium]